MLEDTVVITGECYNLFKQVLEQYECAVQDIMVLHTYTYTITSANDKNHSINSLHYKNKAIDVRINDIPTRDSYRKKLLEAIALMLGSIFIDFVFILHLYDGKNHLHIQHGRDNIISFDNAIGENKNVFIK